MRRVYHNRTYRLATALCAAVVVGMPVAARAQESRPAEAQTQTGAQPASPKPFAALSASAQIIRDSVVQMAKAQIGKRYRIGGTSPEHGFDCSGLVKYVMEALDLRLPRTARQQATQGLALEKDTSRLLPGDLLTFGKNKKGVSHIGIYIGEGKYIHASSTAGRVIESSIDRPYSPLIRIWKGARRILSLDDTAAVSVVAPGKGGGG